jgi:hypothetical protein
VRLGIDGDAVEADHVVEHFPVAALLEGVEGHRLADQGIDDGIGEALHAPGGQPLGLDGEAPEGQPGQPFELVPRQLGPVDGGRLVGIEGGQQHSAEELLVRLGADGYAAAALQLPRVRLGTGRRSRCLSHNFLYR